MNIAKKYLKYFNFFMGHVYGISETKICNKIRDTFSIIFSQEHRGILDLNIRISDSQNI